MAVVQELSENNLNLHLRVQKTSKQLTISIFAPRIFPPTCMFTDKEDSGRGITTVPDKNLVEEWSKNTAKPKEVNYMSSWSIYTSLGRLVKERNSLPWQRHFRGTVEFYKDALQFRTVVLAVEIDEPTTKKIRECGAKETQLGLILVIIASCLIFPINICEFFANLNARGLCINMQGE